MASFRPSRGLLITSIGPPAHYFVGSCLEGLCIWMSRLRRSFLRGCADDETVASRTDVAFRTPHLCFEWHNRAASSVGLLRRWLKEQGWCVLGPWVWRHSNAYSHASERMLSLEGPCVTQDLSRQLHALRYQWRAQHFLGWALGSRHETRDLVSRRGLRRLFRGFQDIDLEKTRLAPQSGGAARAVLLGAVVSDSWLAASQQVPNRCSLSR